MRLTTRYFLLSAALLATQAHAARPMITDDARLTDAGACQVESWAHLHRTQKEAWALPACNPGGNLEITAGGALAWHEGQAESGAVVLQGKTLFKPLETNGWGIGLAAGYATAPGQGQSGAPYVYIPASFSFADDRVVLHTNLGNMRERETRQNHLTWGLGSEIQTSERLYVIAESYGQKDGNPFFQLGLRYWIIPGRAQIDTTYGSRVGHVREEGFISVGLRLISGPVF